MQLITVDPLTYNGSQCRS